MNQCLHNHVFDRIEPSYLGDKWIKVVCKCVKCGEEKTFNEVSNHE